MLKTTMVSVIAGFCSLVFDYLLIVGVVKLVCPKLKPIIVNLPNPFRSAAAYTVSVLMLLFWGFALKFFVWDFQSLFGEMFPGFLSMSSDGLSGSEIQDTRYKIIMLFQVCFAGLYIFVELAKKYPNGSWKKRKVEIKKP